MLCCISSVSYIKPQPPGRRRGGYQRCISSVFYIKPQQDPDTLSKVCVVYRPFPTSNHNCSLICLRLRRLYIVRFLHQTTTALLKCPPRPSCISSVSYIKPQLVRCISQQNSVVYRPFPTSNHNIKFI